MKLDFLIEKGSPDKPACVFIHGMGLNRTIWSSPGEARVMGGMFSIGIMLRGKPELRTLYHDLRAAGCTVAAWSQRRPVGPARAAVEELREVLEMARGVPHAGVVLVGHSRGGIIARCALPGPWAVGEKQTPALDPAEVRALITLGSPHGGSGMARWAVFLSPLAEYLHAALPEGERGRLTSAVKRSLDFLRSKGVRELLPGSELLASLEGQQKPGDAYCLSLGGTDPSLITMPRLFSLPGSLEKVLPGRAVPEEMRSGRGDGLVSAERARLPFGDEHLDFPLNHVEMLFSRKARRAVLERLRVRGII